MLICLTTAIINLTSINFNVQDYKALSSANTKCSRDSQCLKSFTKREQGIYRAYCGNKEYFDKKEFDKAEEDMIRSELSHLPKEEIERKMRLLK